MVSLHYKENLFQANLLHLVAAVGYLGTVVEEPTKKTIYTVYVLLGKGGSRTDYSLRNLPRQDYSRKQRGQFTSRSTTWQPAVKIGSDERSVEDGSKHNKYSTLENDTIPGE